MKTALALIAAAAALALASCSGAEALPSGALSLEASGYAATGAPSVSEERIPLSLKLLNKDIKPVAIDVAFSVRGDGSFGGAGALIVGTTTLDTLDIRGEFSDDSETVELTGVTGDDDPSTIRLEGRLANTRGDDYVYLLTGTLERENAIGKTALAGLLSPILASRSQDAAPDPPLLAADGARTLEGAGYTAVGESIEATSLRMAISEGDDGSFSAAAGALRLGGYWLDGLRLDGSFTHGSRIVSIEGTATGRGDPVSIDLLGRLVEARGEDSAYLFTGTLERGGEPQKTVIVGVVSGDAEPEAGPSYEDIRITLLAAPWQPGAPPGHFDEPVVHVRPGQSVTVANSDAESHRLVSGAINAWFYGRDGSAPRTCAPDGTPDEADDTAQSSRRSSAHIERDRCDFTRDGRVDVTVRAGESATIHIAEPGIYRMLDPAAPWIQLTAVSTDLPDRCPPNCD